MTDQEIRRAVQHAVDHRLSGVREDPDLARRVIAQSKGEAPMKKRISVSLAFILAALLIASAAMAAGLGLFSQLAGKMNDDERLNTLDSVSEALNLTVTADDGVTVEITQAYYEGNRVFIAYRQSGNLYACARHEGAPTGEYAWDWEEADFVYSENMMSENPREQEDILWLNGEGQRWEEMHHAGLLDGLSLADGAYLDIIGGETAWQEDGSVIGWKECEIPEDRLADTLDFKAVLFRTDSVLFQDGRHFYRAVRRGEKTDIPFTLKHNSSAVSLCGEGGTDQYAAWAELVMGQVDMRGTVRMRVPEAWVRVWNTWENPDHIDLVEDWLLFAGDRQIGKHGVQSESVDGADTLVFELLFPRPEAVDDLALVPVYAASGLRENEAIRLER